MIFKMPLYSGYTFRASRCHNTEAILTKGVWVGEREEKVSDCKWPEHWKKSFNQTEAE